MNKIQASLLLTLLLLLPLQVQASEGHTMPTISGQQQVADMFLEKKMIDGYHVSFHIMKAEPGQEHGGSHNVMIKVEKNGAVLGNVLINSKVVSPAGKSAQKRLMKMGDWYMNGYDLGESGTYKVMILFKTADDKKHKGGVTYPVQ
jgi:hypothetical protein